MLSLGFMGVLTADAAMPEVSTDAAPKWYYIQVVGEDARKDRVFTAVDNSDAVYGRPMVMSTNFDEVSPQLWRFETSGQGYAIISKSTGKRLDVTYDPTLDISKAVLNDEPAVDFSFVPYGDSFQITCSKAPAGGIESEVYLHQANVGGGRDFVIMLVNTTWSNTVNSSFHFVEFVDFTVERSTDSRQVYYQVRNSCYPDLCMAQIPSADYPLQLAAPRDDDYTQQWYVTDGGNDKVRLVNRATGHTLLTSSVPYKTFNMPLLETAENSAGARTMQYLGLGRYAIGGEEEDGIVRWLNASTETAGAPEGYDESTAADKGFGWTFHQVGTSAAIEQPAVTTSGVKIDGRRIMAANPDDELRVFTSDGREVSASNALGCGIYIVLVNGQASKVIIR